MFALFPVMLSKTRAFQQGAMPPQHVHIRDNRTRTRVYAQMNYYDILGIDPEASQDEIRRAFRQRAKLLHPDVNKAPDADKAFRILKRAADVLSDKMLRMEHDQQLDLPSARASNPRFARFERWRREVVPDLRMQLEVWGNEIYLILSTAADTLTTQEQLVKDMLQGSCDEGRRQAVQESVAYMQGVLQDAVSNSQRLYDKRYQQVEVRYPAYPAIVWYDVWEEVSEDWQEASRTLEQEWRPRIQCLASLVALSS